MARFCPILGVTQALSDDAGIRKSCAPKQNKPFAGAQDGSVESNHAKKCIEMHDSFHRFSCEKSDLNRPSCAEKVASQSAHTLTETSAGRG